VSDRARELAEAMEQARLRASPHLYIRPFPTSLRPSKPLQQPSKPVSGDIVADPIPEVPAVSEAPRAAEMAPSIAAKSDVEPVWRALLDVTVWRTRWFWKLVASLDVKRLRR
jgi:hypothetical protein